MSRQLINLNADLTELQKEGYEVTVQFGHLVIFNIPYLNDLKQLKSGTLISVLELSGDKTVNPISDHKAFFVGEHPCDQNGIKLNNLAHSSQRTQLGSDLVADHMFSSKPKEGYRDYHHKMQTYAEMISSPARAIDPNANARTHIIHPTTKSLIKFSTILTPVPHEQVSQQLRRNLHFPEWVLLVSVVRDRMCSTS